MSRDRLTEKDQFGKWRTEMLPHELANYLTVHDFEDGIRKDYLYCPAIDRLAAYEDLIFSPEVLQAIIKEWKEWADAKNDGRLLILPCKDGDPVYQLVGPCVPSFGTCPYDGGYGTYRCGPPERCKPYIEEMKFSVTMMPHFGRIYFKTKEEAKKALEERYGK